MPQTLYNLAQTQQQIIEQRFLSDDLGSLSGNKGSPLIYRGRTVGNTPTEIFIAGKTHAGTGNLRRLYLPESSGCMFEAYAMAFNQTDVALAHACKYYGGYQNLAGTLSHIQDYDLATGSNQGWVKDAVVATVAQGMNHQPSSTVVTFTTSGTAIIVTVTGIAAKTVDWTVYLIPYVCSQTGNRFYGDSAAGVGT